MYSTSAPDITDGFHSLLPVQPVSIYSQASGSDALVRCSRAGLLHHNGTGFLCLNTLCCRDASSSSRAHRNPEVFLTANKVLTEFQHPTNYEPSQYPVLTFSGLISIQQLSPSDGYCTSTLIIKTLHFPLQNQLFNKAT